MTDAEKIAAITDVLDDLNRLRAHAEGKKRHGIADDLSLSEKEALRHVEEIIRETIGYTSGDILHG